MASPPVFGTACSIRDSHDPCAVPWAGAEMKHDAFALVTGASRGLGMAFARELAARHQNLVLVARSLEPLNALASELRHSNSVSVVTLRMDLASPGAGQRLAQAISDS